MQEEKKEEKKEDVPEKNQEKKEQNNAVIDSNKEVSVQSSIEADEAKKIVESITDSITGGEKQECKYIFITNLTEKFVIQFTYRNLCDSQWKTVQRK